MKILVDFVGHADLYYSMHLLFEKRLGHELYRPTGEKELGKPIYLLRSRLHQWVPGQYKPP
jgi:hypothetical protein